MVLESTRIELFTSIPYTSLSPFWAPTQKKGFSKKCGAHEFHSIWTWTPALPCRICHVVGPKG